MKPVDILEKIVSTNGSCDWAGPSTCAECPFSKLKQREDGTYLSCLDALNADIKDKKEQNKLYLQAAKEYLISENIDALLGKS